MKTDTKWIQKIENVGGSTYQVFIRKNKNCEWIYLGEVPRITIAHALVKAGRDLWEKWWNPNKKGK